MSSSEEEIKEANKKDTEIKLFMQLAENKNRKQQENEEYERLLNTYGIDVLKDPKLLRPEEQKDVLYVAPEGPKTQHSLEALKSAYQNKTGKEPIQTEKGLELSFSSKEEAVEFFKEQSRTVAFDAYCAEEDHRVYSDGKGTFVHGTKEQVSEYLKKPEAFELGNDGQLNKKDELHETSTYNL